MVIHSTERMGERVDLTLVRGITWRETKVEIAWKRESGPKGARWNEKDRSFCFCIIRRFFRVITFFMLALISVIAASRVREAKRRNFPLPPGPRIFQRTYYRPSIFYPRDAAFSNSVVCKLQVISTIFFLTRRPCTKKLISGQILAKTPFSPNCDSIW